MLVTELQQLCSAYKMNQQPKLICDNSVPNKHLVNSKQ